jgi:nucleoside-diphosphate-sugar epimerase
MTEIISETEKKYLLTGATGFLGSHIMTGLLLKGYGVVIAGRSSGAESLEDRVRRLLTWFGIEHLEGLLEFHETDFLKPMMGLEEDEYEKLCSMGLKIIHCASDTSFAERNRERVMKSNVESLSELLRFAHESRTPHFYFISTAYAAGSDRIECPEAPINSVHFTNVYEESKAQAENIISSACRKFDIPFTLLRPSIVYGSSVTGRSLKFNALYYPIRSLQLIRDIYLNDIDKNKGRKSTGAGVYKNGNGKLNLPIRISIHRDGKLNLIPVDYFTETVLSILENPEPETFYNITCNNPVDIMELVSFTERFLNITGIEIVNGTSVTNKIKNPAEQLFDHFIEPYLPYISDKRIFARNNTDEATKGILPPDFDYELFKRCMDFAVSVEWGKTLFC